MPSHNLSRLSKQHLEQAVALSLAEKWPYRLDNWEMLFILSRGVVGLKRANVLGPAMRTHYGQDVSMLSMIIVANSERWSALGCELVTYLTLEASDRELRLIAAPKGLPFYEKLGFQLDGQII